MTKAAVLFAASFLLPSLAYTQIDIATEKLPIAARGAPYRAQIQTGVDGRCDRGDVSLSIVSGSLPTA